MPVAYEWMKVLGCVSLRIGVPLENLGRGSVYQELWELAEGGFWLWSIFLYGSSVREPGGGSFAGDPVGYESKALETGISLHGGSVEQPGVGSTIGDFERWLKGTLVVGCLFLWELCEKNLEGGLPCWGPWRIGRKGSGDGHNFPQGPRGGTWKGAHLPGTLRDGWTGL